MLTVGAVAEPRISIRREVLLASVRPATHDASPVDIESLTFGPEFLRRPQMPFACEHRRITLRLERFGKRCFFEGHDVVQRGGKISRGSPAAKIISRVHSRRIFPRHDAVPSWTAYRIGRVALSESHSGCGDAIDIGSLVKCLRVVAPYIHVAQVIHEKENNVGRALLGRVDSQKGQGHSEGDRKEEFLNHDEAIHSACLDGMNESRFLRGWCGFLDPVCPSNRQRRKRHDTPSPKRPRRIPRLLTCGGSRRVSTSKRRSIPGSR